MTRLVLDLRVPASTAGRAYSEHALAAALVRLGPSLAAYLLSFTMLGTFWLAQHTLLSLLGRRRLLAEHPPARPGTGMGRPVWAPAAAGRPGPAGRLPAQHVPAPDPAGPGALRARGAGLPDQHPGQRGHPGRRPAVLHHLAPAVPPAGLIGAALGQGGSGGRRPPPAPQFGQRGVDVVAHQAEPVVPLAVGGMNGPLARGPFGGYCHVGVEGPPGSVPPGLDARRRNWEPALSVRLLLRP
jgi:hypothetical protein